jgi:osmotically-inducible protein OsmY
MDVVASGRSMPLCVMRKLLRSAESMKNYLASWVLVLLAGSVGWTIAHAQRVAASANGRIDEVVVRGKRQIDPVADANLQRQVEAALAADPYFLSEHVSVTIRNGVATLHGIVFDDWDLRNALRISRRIPGVKRVVNDLEIKLGGE